ncbi:MAG: hypothetical protein GEU83_06105 [Pseudonocardiaceae bacterium]|nr:hypothetical protein [Pseudonocardiaceae bacterium]
MLLVGGMVTLVFVDEIAVGLTPYAEHWSAALRGAVRVAAGIAVVVAARIPPGSAVPAESR